MSNALYYLHVVAGRKRVTHILSMGTHAHLLGRNDTLINEYGGSKVTMPKIVSNACSSLFYSELSSVIRMARWVVSVFI